MSTLLCWHIRRRLARDEQTSIPPMSSVKRSLSSSLTSTTISVASTVYIQQASGNTQYQIGSTSGSWNNIVFPATIVNTDTANTLNVRFENNLIMSSTSHYFIMGSQNITIDGQNNTVNVSNVPNYPGLVQNGTSGLDGKDNIIIQNLGITLSPSTTLANEAGWVGQQYMNKNSTGCQVNNCYSTGAISRQYSGGIFGYSSTGAATNCYSSGAISGTYAGGIFGGSSTGTATNCYSKGAISGQGVGGIFGYGSSGTATNCYSIEAISGQWSGGIFGASGRGTATNCYSSGAINGIYAGGIFGISSTGTAINCYSTGAISGTDAGGIFGHQSLSTARAINCYSTGAISSQFARAIFGGTFSGIAINCYPANVSWSDITAAGILLGVPTYNNGTLTEQGATWIDITPSGQNTPWLLKSFNNQIYDPNTLTLTNQSGSTGNAIISTGVDYQLIDVNNTTVNSSNFTGISSSTGAITFSNLVSTTYTVRVLRKLQNLNPPVGYQINTFSIAPPTTISATSTVYIQQASGNTQYQIGSTSGSWNNIFFPATIVNTDTANTMNVKFENILTMSSTSHYFVMGSQNITIDGQNNTVNVSNVSNYPGLVQNGTSGSDGQDNIIIQNLGITSSPSTSLAVNAGWVGQRHMNNNATGCQVNNCYSTGAISGANAGGILGRDSSGIATNCYSTGIISGDDGILEYGAGGIFGTYSSGTAINCYSSGNISGKYAGGIFGDYGNNNKAINCYSKGDIIGQYAGGICGYLGTATNCYSTGAISGANAGGIFGSDSSGIATNCYSSGAISGLQAGGIFGAASSGTATNCYSSGAISSGIGAEGIFGGGGGTNNNSLHTTGWSDLTAASTLTGAPTYSSGTLTAQGTTWIDINLSATDTPWLLKSFNIQLYSPNTLTLTTQSGTTRDAIIITGVDYQIIDVNNTTVNNSNFTGISSSTGAITFSNLGYTTYTVRVLRKTAGSTTPVGYQINTFSIYPPALTSFTVSPTAIDDNTTYTGLLTANNNLTGVVYSVLSTTLSPNVIFTIQNQTSLVSNIPITYSLTSGSGTFQVVVRGAKAGNNVDTTFTITVNPTLTNFILSPLEIREGEIYLGTLTSDSTQPTSYSIISQSIDNLYISGSNVIARYPFSYYLTRGIYRLIIQAISGNIIIYQMITIRIIDVPQPPVNITLTNNRIAEDAFIGTLIGRLQTTDPDENDIFTYKFVEGEGSYDNNKFIIDNDKMINNTTFNYNTKNIYTTRVKSTDKFGFSIEIILLIYVIIPIANGDNLSALLGTNKQIVLQGTPASDAPMEFVLLSETKYGTLTKISNGFYNYMPLENKVDSFQYIIKQGSMTSLPGTVVIHNFSVEDIDNIPKRQGTFSFDSITFDGTTWTFGTIRTYNFFQYIDFNTLGNLRLYNTS